MILGFAVLLLAAVGSRGAVADDVIGVQATMSFEDSRHERYSLSAGRFVLIHGDRGTLVLKTKPHQDLGKADFHEVIFAGHGYSARFDTREDMETHASIFNESEPGDILHPFELLVLLDRIDESSQVGKKFEGSSFLNVVMSDNTTVEGDLNKRVIEVEYWFERYDLTTKEYRLMSSPIWHKYEIKWRLPDRSDREVTVWLDTTSTGQPVHYKDFRPAGEPEMSWYEAGGVPLGTPVNTIGGETPYSYVWQGKPQKPPFRYWGLVIGVAGALLVVLVVVRLRNAALVRENDPFAPLR